MWRRPLFIRSPVSHDDTTSCHHTMTNYRNLASQFDKQLPRVKLNKWQLGSLKSKLSETLDSVNGIFGSTPTSSPSQPSGWERCEPVLRELDRIVAGASALIQECSTPEWLKAAIKVADSEELFVKYHAELEWYVALLRIASAEQYHHERVEKLRSFDWDASVHAIRSSIKEAALKDRTEFLELLKQKISTSRNPADCNLAQFLLHKFDSGRPGTSDESGLLVERPQELGIKEPGPSIGSGASSEVYRNNWMGEPYCRKVFTNDKASFKNDTKMLTGLFHPHIVLMVCSFVDAQGKGCMLMELMSEDLQKFIKRKVTGNTAPGAAPFEALLKAVDIMLQIGEGMTFLHQKKWSHRDLKPCNILVNSEPHVVVKIGDFGLAKLKETSASLSEQTPNVGTTRWRAPELCKEAGSTSRNARKADVWSFALICAHILTGKLPFDGLDHSAMYTEKTTGRARPDLPPHLPGALVKLLQSCWELVPDRRPAFSNICQKLRLLKGILLIESCAIPPQLPSQPQSIEENWPGLLDATDFGSTVTRALVVGNSKDETSKLIQKLSRTSSDHNAEELEEFMHPSLPSYFYDSRGLDHKKQLYLTENFVKARNSYWTIDRMIERWQSYLRPWLCGKDQGPLNKDRIHIVWFVYSIFETPGPEWTTFLQRIKKYNLPVQIVVTHYPGQDPNGEKLWKNILAKRVHLQCPRKEQIMTVDLETSRIDMIHPADSLSTEYLQNPNDNSIWDAFQVMRMTSDIKQAARIISELRMELGLNGFLISRATFRDAPKSYTYTKSAFFFLTTLCEFWEVPQKVQTALTRKMVGGTDYFVRRDGQGELQLKPGTFLAFSAKTAAVILYMKVVHYPRGWTPVDEAKYGTDIDECFVYLDTKVNDTFNLCSLEKKVPRYYSTKAQASKKLARYLQTTLEEFLQFVREDQNVTQVRPPPQSPPSNTRPDVGLPATSTSPLSLPSTTPVPPADYSCRSVLQMLKLPTVLIVVGACVITLLQFLME